MTTSTAAYSCRMVNRATGQVVVPRLRVAATFASRFRGLQLCSMLAADEALLLAPCSSIHTCFMRFAIDVAWLDRAGKVLSVKINLRPWRVAAGPRAALFALETSAGSLRAGVGDMLALQTDLPRVAAILRPLTLSPPPAFSPPPENR
jgi:uncharacterized membrane protein (UPF0127 family)